MNPVRVIISDSQYLFGESLFLLLQLNKNLEMVMIDRSRSILPQIIEKSIDIVLIDLPVPAMSSLETMKNIRTNYPGIKIIVLCTSGNEKYLYQAIKAGANAFLDKNVAFQTLESAISQVMESGYFFNDHNSKNILMTVMNRKHFSAFNDDVSLTNRELEVLQLICQELTNNEIADKLSLSQRTIDGFRNKLLMKTGCKNSVGLAMFAMRNNLISIE